MTWPFIVKIYIIFWPHLSDALPLFYNEDTKHPRSGYAFRASRQPIKVGWYRINLDIYVVAFGVPRVKTYVILL